MFKKILIANRGEIACRISSTAKKMGIKTVGIYSRDDYLSKHTEICDEAILLNSSETTNCYLDINNIIEIAKSTNSQAIHPGYGFLSENSTFAKACQNNGVKFIGPSAESIEIMGSKSFSKAHVEKLKIPTLPSYHGTNQNVDLLLSEAKNIEFPILLKPSLGGGGKGMRVVNKEEEFFESLKSCKRESINSFGDDKILIEKYLKNPKHIEVQVISDMYGNHLHLFERDCSIQRRYQKIIEEAPSNYLDEKKRNIIGEMAVSIARSVKYEGVGTVEFIFDEEGKHYFLEMNTRLQVEHPVTEMIANIDLVEWQLKIAYGEKLSLDQKKIKFNGHSIEARLYAENPNIDFLPSSGKIYYLQFPKSIEFSRNEKVRIDSGIRKNDEITDLYDPMLAKLIVHGANRSEAITIMSRALSNFEIVGPHTNIEFLKNIIDSKEFSSGKIDTNFIDKNKKTLLENIKIIYPEVLALVVSKIFLNESSLSSDPWKSSFGWRLNSTLIRKLIFFTNTSEIEIKIKYQKQGLDFSFDEKDYFLSNFKSHGNNICLKFNDLLLNANVIFVNNYFYVFYNEKKWELKWEDIHSFQEKNEYEKANFTSPMPGKIISLLVNKNDFVEKGLPLLTIEAMKMEHTIVAPSKGIIKDIMFKVGQHVKEGDQLILFSSGEESD